MIQRGGTRVSIKKPRVGVARLVPNAVVKSPLMKKGGYEVFEGVPDEETFERMRSEALSLLPGAYENDLAVSEAGGIPARRHLRATSRNVQRDFYHRLRTLRFIREVSGLRAVPTGALGGYLYYTRPGDYIAIHRDGEGCDLAVITCLCDAPNHADDGGILCLYPERVFEKIDEIRATPGQGAVKMRLLPGQTMVLFGGFVAHSVLPVSNGQARIVSSLCYRLDRRQLH